MNQDLTLKAGKPFIPDPSDAVLYGDNSYAAVIAQRTAIRFEEGRPIEGLMGKS